MSHIIISAAQVSKQFRAFEALKKVSFEVVRGECFGLLGPNGAGKSTLISLLYGLREKSAGQLKVFDLAPEIHARAIKKRLGVVTQENALDESLTVEENMLIYAAFMGVPRAERAARVATLLKYMQLEHKTKSGIRMLSGGMKRRLVFVRALLGNPDLIILDEPTTGLDPAIRHLLWGKVKELKEQGKTILITTHYMHEAEILCDRVLVLNKGEAISEGSPAQLIKEHTPGYVAVFENSRIEQQQRAFAKERGFHLHEDSSAAYFRAAELEDLIQLQKQIKQTALQLRPANLEDVFLKLTGQELAADA
jgi:lipooligosaccharide transport system ATP-binding protein